MLTEKSTAKGINGHIYQLGKKIGAGGEGTVYAVEGAADLVLKVYLRPVPELEEKLKYMVWHPAPRLVDRQGNTIMNLAWPRDVVYDGAGQFAGYVMPRVSGGVEFFEIERGCASAQARKLFPNYTWQLNVQTARNLAAAVMILHQNNYVIGDMNCKNMLVNADGSINMLDTDSFDITDPATGKHYKCCVGTEEYLAPELQGVNLASAKASFTTYADDFALAIHIFRLLMNNRHPFTCRQLTQTQNSANQNKLLDNVAQGKCPYIHRYQDFGIPLGAPTLEEIVPDYILQDFTRTFDYTESTALARAHDRTTAAQWLEDLKKLFQECSTGLVRCSRNPDHFYLQSKGECGMCKAQKRFDDFVNGPKPAPNDPPVIPIDLDPVEPVTTPAKPKPWKKVLAVAAAVAVLLLGILIKSGAFDDKPSALRGASSTPMVSSVDVTDLQGIPLDQETQNLLKSEPESYEYFDDSHLLMYFNAAGHERCRIYKNPNDELLYVFVADYNDAGDVTVHKTYDGEGALLRTDLFSYDSDGHCVEERIIREDGRPGRTITRTYDQQGRFLTYEEKVDDGTVLDYTIATYDASGRAHRTWIQYDGSYGESSDDENGNQISYTAWNEDGSVNFQTESTYDSAGRETQSSSVYGLMDGGFDFGTATYQYDGNDKRTEVKRYDTDGTLESTESYLYGPNDIEMGSAYDYGNGQSIYGYIRSIVGTHVYGVSTYSSDDYFSYSITLYDVMGNYLREISCDADGVIKSDSESLYDDYGQQTQRYYTYYRSDGSSTRTRYISGERDYEAELDANGNQTDLTRYFYDYDSDGRVIKETSRNQDDAIIAWTEYTRDYRGWVTKETDYNADGSIRSWSDITYDEYGQPDREYHYNG